jgi:diacylglycerol kinase (ATP)
VRLALIANPRSGSAPSPDELARLLAADGAEVVTTAIEDLDRAAVCRAGRPDRLVVAGGDGSIGRAALLAAELGVPLAVLPAGTANDFARAQELPLQIEAAAQIARAPQASLRPAQLALAGDRPFVNAAAAGLSVVAARAADAHKSRLGPLAYAVGAVRAAATASPLRCVVRCDGSERFSGAVWQVIVGATGAFGGGSSIGASSQRADELRDVAVIPAGSRIGLARRAYGMRAGTLTAQDDVTHERGAVVELKLSGSPSFNIDGELCECEPARFELRPGGFRVVVA